MPHLTLEYTADLAATRPADLLPRLNRQLADSGLFAEADIKSRAICLDDWCVGTAATTRGFIHVRLAVLAGRPQAIRRQLADALLATLRRDWPSAAGSDTQWCVEVVEIDGDTYAKASA